MDNKLIDLLARAQWQAGALVFLLPCLALVTAWGVSTMSFLIIVAALYHFSACSAALAAHWPAVRWVVVAFGVNFLFATCTWLLRPEAGSGSMGKPLRMLLSLAALALVLAARPARAWLWRGVAAGAIGGALLVGYQRIVLGLERPGGLMNAITSGDILILFGLLALVGMAGAACLRRSGWQALGAVGALAGFAGSVMTGTRGGWIAVLLVLALLARYGSAVRPWRTLAAGLAGVALLAVAWMVPATGVNARIAQGVADVNSYMDGGSAYTNIGIRLAVWDGAMVLAAERPLLGADYPTYRRELARHVAEGRLDPVVLPVVHFHNDALQALVAGGVVGLLVWCATLAAPAWFFVRMLALRDAAAGRRHLPALAGLVVVTSYFAFGLTEVIFWSVRATLLYALLVCMLMGLCLNVKEFDGKYGRRAAPAAAD